MAELKISLAVVYIDADKLYYSAGGKILTVDLPPAVFRDLEVAKDPLIQTLQQFIQTQKIGPASLILVFSERLYLEKDFATNLTTQDKEAVAFAEIAPFERVLSRTYPNKTGSKGIALNRNIYEAVRDGFLPAGFSIHSAIPAHVFSLLGVSKLDEAAVGQIIRRSDEVRQLSILTLNVAPLSLEEREEELAKKHTPLILGVFVVFIIAVLGLTFYVLTQQQQAVRRPAPTPSLAPSSTPSPTPLATPIATSAAIFVPEASASVTISPSVRQ